MNLEAVTIFLVGMIAVFTVLSLVVLTGNVLVRIVNHFHKEATINYVATEMPYENEISAEEIAAITAAVQVVTQGKGSIVNIEKV